MAAARHLHLRGDRAAHSPPSDERPGGVRAAGVGHDRLSARTGQCDGPVVFLAHGRCGQAISPGINDPNPRSMLSATRPPCCVGPPCESSGRDSGVIRRARSGSYYAGPTRATSSSSSSLNIALPGRRPGRAGSARGAPTGTRLGRRPVRPARHPPAGPATAHRPTTGLRPHRERLPTATRPHRARRHRSALATLRRPSRRGRPGKTRSS